MGKSMLLELTLPPSSAYGFILAAETPKGVFYQLSNLFSLPRTMHVFFHTLAIFFFSHRPYYSYGITRLSNYNVHIWAIKSRRGRARNGREMRQRTNRKLSAGEADDNNGRRRRTQLRGSPVLHVSGLVTPGFWQKIQRKRHLFFKFIQEMKYCHRGLGFIVHFIHTRAMEVLLWVMRFGHNWTPFIVN